MHSQDIPREIVRAGREETYVHAFVTVPVWHNPSAGRGNPSRDHRTPPKDARAAGRSGHVIALLLAMAALAMAGFVASYAAIPADASILVFPLGRIEALNFSLGMTLSVALSCLGASAHRWARIQMHRLETAGRSPRSTGTRLIDPTTNQPLRPSDIAVGSIVPARREAGPGRGEHVRPETDDAVLILARLRPDDIRDRHALDRSQEGIVAFSKTCTHSGCPTTQYTEQTHHVPCPCHQFTFDPSDGARATFGPVPHALPQLRIGVNDEGYLEALGDFEEPVGPAFRERA
ncbi:Rieske (2Fe-2S) protein [Streptomyces adelaidensis]|uniref:Rieske (2Fe-2S) protein n=1 Tax=Streptomyces adelaidensis TaxID=2796465 RepID=UPI001903ECBC|nr:Rieske (2Fe-2S) protein [Streptomyces adelaidensis]